MTRPSSHNDRERGYELALHRYIKALDSADFETVAEVLTLAETDPELDRRIAAVNDAIYAEAGLTPREQQAQTVRKLLAQHIPSGMPQPEPEAPAPLTVGDVAAKLQADQATGRPTLLSDRDTNTRLLGNTTPLPDRMTEAAITRLATDLGAGGSERYWEEFRHAATRLGMARASGHARLAARHQRPTQAGTNRPRRGGTRWQSSDGEPDAEQ